MNAEALYDFLCCLAQSVLQRESGDSLAAEITELSAFRRRVDGVPGRQPGVPCARRHPDRRRAGIGGCAVNRLLAAYRALWDRHPAAAGLTLLGVILGSASTAILAAWWFPNWSALPAAITVTALFLLWSAPGDSPERTK